MRPPVLLLPVRPTPQKWRRGEPKVKSTRPGKPRFIFERKPTHFEPRTNQINRYMPDRYMHSRRFISHSESNPISRSGRRTSAGSNRGRSDIYSSFFRTSVRSGILCVPGHSTARQTLAPMITRFHLSPARFTFCSLQALPVREIRCIGMPADFRLSDFQASKPRINPIVHAGATLNGFWEKTCCERKQPSVHRGQGRQLAVFAARRPHYGKLRARRYVRRRTASPGSATFVSPRAQPYAAPTPRRIRTPTIQLSKLLEACLCKITANWNALFPFINHSEKHWHHSNHPNKRGIS